MASVAENQALVNSLFAPAVNTFAQYNQAQVALAQQAREERMQRELLNIRRQQALADQQAQFRQQMALANLQRETQLDLEQGRMSRAEEAVKAADAKEDKRNAQQIALRRLAAYSDYARTAAQAGVTPEPIESFGEGEEAVIKIAAAKSNVEANVLESAATDLATERANRLGNLRKFEEGQTRNDEIRARAAALASIDEDDAERFEATRQAKGEAAALKLLKPDQRAAYQTDYMGTLQNLRVQRLESPEYKALQTEVQSLDRLIQPLVTQNPSLTKLFRPKEVASSTPKPATDALPSVQNRASALGATINNVRVPTNTEVAAMLQDNQSPDYGLDYWMQGMINPNRPSTFVPGATPEITNAALNRSLRRLTPTHQSAGSSGIPAAALQTLMRQPVAPAITPVRPELTITPVTPELTITPAPLANIYGPR